MLGTAFARLRVNKTREQGKNGWRHQSDQDYHHCHGNRLIADVPGAILGTSLKATGGDLYIRVRPPRVESARNRSRIVSRKMA
jgi:hypothetical protein